MQQSNLYIPKLKEYFQPLKLTFFIKYKLKYSIYKDKLQTISHKTTIN